MGIRIEANYKNLERASSWVVNADTKASLILAFNGGLFAHLMTKTPEMKTLLIKQGLGISSSILLIVSGLFILFFILSIRNCFKTIRPSLDAKTPSVFYFGTIQNLSLDIFKQKMKSLDEESIEEELINQTHIVSTVAYKKFNSIRKALNSLIASLIFWGGILLTLNFFL
ncbi:MAG: Pycsar system effector family protein [Thermodesulfobacteriota bacterium]